MLSFKKASRISFKGSLILAVILVLGLVGSVLAWTEPSSFPPTGNVPAPINVGSTAQSKSGTIGATQFIDANNPGCYLDPSSQTYFCGNINFNTGGLIDSQTTVGVGQNDLTISGTDYLVFKGGYQTHLYGGGVLGITIGSTEVNIPTTLGVGVAAGSYKTNINGKMNATEVCIGGDCRNSWAAAVGSSGGINYAINGSFENNTNGWSLYGNSSRVADAGVGSYSISNSDAYPFLQQGGLSIPTNGSKTFTFSTWAKQSGGATLLFYIYTGTGPDGGWFNCGNVAPTTAWQRYSVSCAITGTVSTIRFYRLNQTGTIYVDGVQLEEGTSASVYKPGIFSSSDGTINLNGVSIASNVGIGTASPSDKLEVIGVIKSSDADSNIKMFSTDNGYIQSSNDLYLWGSNVRLASAAGEGLRVANTGNVGIGTVSPTAKLELNGQIKITDGTQGANKVLTSDASGLASWQTPASGGVGGAGTGVANKVAKWLNTSTLTNSIITDDGTNVGIGAAVPTAKLDVAAPTAAGNTMNISRFASGGYASIKSTDANGYLIMDSNGQAAALNWYSPDNVILARGGGSVGIGTTGPGAKLQVQTSNNGLNIIGGFRNENGTESGGNAVGIGFVNEAGGTWWKAAIVHERKDSYGQGTLHFLLDNTADSSSVTLSDAKMSITKDGNVGIGTTAPGAKLEVVGSASDAIRIAGPTAGRYGQVYHDGNNLIIGTNAAGAGYGGMIFANNNNVQFSGNGDIYFTKSGNVGIGTTNPGAKLEVAGQIKITGGTPGAGKVLTTVDGSGLASWQTPAGGVGGAGTANKVSKWLNANTLTDSIIIDDGTNVGVGMSPTAKLEIIAPASGDTMKISRIAGQSSIKSTDANGYLLLDSNGQATALNWYSPDNVILARGGGSVGIGTNAPQDKLHVSNTGGSTALSFSIDGTNSRQGRIEVNNDAAGGTSMRLSTLKSGVLTEQVRITDQGNVGIGTTNPQSILDVYGDAKYIRKTWPSSGSYGGIDFYQASTRMASIEVMGSAFGGARQNDMEIAARNGGDLSLQTWGGNVGIGNSAPTAKLEVTGQIKIVDGTQGAGKVLTTVDGSGLASWQALSSVPGAGDITSVVAGTGLTGGGISGDVTLNVNTVTVQSRVSGTCAAGSSIRVINQDGTVTCETDDVGAGGGIGGSGTLNYIPKFTPNGTTIGISQIFDNGTNVGIGTASPGAKLDIGVGAAGRAGYTDLLVGRGADYPQIELYGTTKSAAIQYYDGSGLSFYVNGSSWNQAMFINESGNVGIGTGNPTYKLDVNGTLRVTGNATFSKINVTTIDPVYEIDGKKYATYVSDFAGGVRVETSGIAEVSTQSEKENLKSKIYEYAIDLNNLEKGSDLWLFWQTSNKNINDLVVVLTPGFDGKVWYEKQNNKLIIFGDQSGEISYRLTAPRQDYQDWGNLINPSD